MDERLKNIIDNLDAKRIGLDEPFKFHCTCWGKCRKWRGAFSDCCMAEKRAAPDGRG